MSEELEQKIFECHEGHHIDEFLLALLNVTGLIAVCKSSGDHKAAAVLFDEAAADLRNGQPREWTN